MPPKASAPPASLASSEELVQAILRKRQTDLVMAAHRALAKHLRRDKDFAKRYPTFKMQPYQTESDVGIRIGTRRPASRDEYDWENIGAVLRLDQGVVGPGEAR